MHFDTNVSLRTNVYKELTQNDKESDIIFVWLMIRGLRRLDRAAYNQTVRQYWQMLMNCDRILTDGKKRSPRETAISNGERFLFEGEEMEHSFEINIAKRYGIPSAILLKNLYFWIDKNRANDSNFYDGYFWTYNSKKAFAELFPYMTARQIEYALQKLIDDGLVITGNYNKVAYDRTLWYAITKKGYSILQNCEMEETNLGNGNNENVKPIPNINADRNSNIKTDSDVPPAETRSKRFTPPTVEEVIAYCSERGNNVDAQRFVDYYTSNGWQVGKNKMKDWRAAVRTWERNSTSRQSGSIAIKQNASTDLDDIF